MSRLICMLCLIALPATAQDWAMRDGDQVLDKETLTARLVGRSITFYDNGQSIFEENGGYSYTYYQGGTAFGQFEIGDDGIVCIDFANGFSRCDRYVDNDGRFILLTTDGYRFPIRPDEG